MSCWRGATGPRPGAWISPCIGVALLWAGAARAEPTTRVGVEYSASELCPSRTAFIARLLVRTARAELATDAPAELTIHLELTANATQYRGVLRIGTTGSPLSERVVDADTCPEVVDALALVAALTIDPAADTAELSSAVVAAAEEAVAAQSSEAAAPMPPGPTFDPLPLPPATVRRTARAPRPAPAPLESDGEVWTDDSAVRGPRNHAPPTAHRSRARRAARARGPRDPRPPRDAARGAFGATAELSGATAPTTMVVARAFVELAAPHRPGAPSVGLSVAGGSAESETPVASATLTWLTARVDVCPLDALAAGWFAARPCLAVDGGTLRGVGRPMAIGPVEEAHSATLPWASVAALARGDFTPAAPLRLRLEAGLVMPVFSGAGFYFGDPGDPYTALDVPALSYSLGAGLGVEWR